MHRVQINFTLFKFIFLLPGNGKEDENVFLQKKKYNWDQCHFVNSTESVKFHTENYSVHGLLTQTTIV